jgi:hypothetical protein
MGDRLASLFTGFGRGTHSLFGGSPDPRLSPEQNAQASRDALIHAGLAAIIGSGPGSPGTLPTLAAAAIQGRQTGTQNRAQAVQRGGQQQIAQLLQQGGVDLPQLRQSLIQAISTGDIETAKLLTATITSMQSAQPNPVNLQQFEGVNPETGLTELGTFNPRGGGREFSGIEAPSSSVQYQTVQMPGDDQPYVYALDPRSGTPIARVGLPVNQGSGDGTSQERLNARLAGVAESANAQLSSGLDERLAGIGVNLARQEGLIGAVANFFLSDEGQTAGAVALQFLNPTVRYLSGAQMTEQESLRYYRALMPRFGERQAAIEQKRRARQDLIDAMDSGRLPSTRDEALALLDRHGLSIDGQDEPLPWEEDAPAPAPNLFPPR